MRRIFLLISLLCASFVAQAAPTVTLTASPSSGISPVTVTLTWSSTEVTSCAASGGWAGTKATSGSETISNVTATSTYTLTCSAGAGSAQVQWTAPTKNTDGSTLTNLAGFKLYHAATSAGVATATPIQIASPTATSYTITGLPAGVRYYGMKAYNSAGVDSDLTALVNNTIVLASASQSATVTVSTKPNPPVIVTVEQTAYELVPDRWSGSKLGRVVGIVPLGTACVGGLQVATRKGAYYEVPLDQVTLTRMPRSVIVVAKCASSG